jgi:hypothetical protein
MPSLAYILGVGGPLIGWASIACLLLRASDKPVRIGLARPRRRRVR